jgi:CYTH domain-containing protein
MGFEIERKFLVRGDAWKISSRTVRAFVRAISPRTGRLLYAFADDGSATLSLKSRGAELRRLELEYKVPTNALR